MATPYVISSDLVSAYPAKSLEIAQYIDGFKADLALVQNAQTGTTYTFVAADFTKLVTFSNASPVAVTVPLESSVPWPTGTQLRLLNIGAGVVTVAGAVGVTINGTPLTFAQYKNATLIKTGTNIWSFIGSAAAPGMDLITPTSVAGTGVTLSGGQVSFSAATAVSVNGCFTSAYDTYRVVMYGGASAISIAIDARLRLAGTDNSTASSYVRTFVRGVSNTASAAIITGTSFANIAVTDTDIWTSTFDVVRPALASMTGFLGSFHGSGVVSSDYTAAFGGRHNQAVAYDGISIIPASGNITGTLRVYGLRNS